MKDLFDETEAATKPVRRLRERDVQAACVRWWRAKTRYNCRTWARKFSSPAQRSVPDYLFSYRTPAASGSFAVEFKAPGKRVSDAQAEEIAEMQAAGWEVHVVDSVEQFKCLAIGRVE
jgi:hypothetical protein